MPARTTPFTYEGKALTCDGVPLEELAEEYGTPLYVYSAETIRRNFRRIAAAFKASDPLLAYSVKANGNLTILRLLAREGAGFDIVSGGELHLVQKAGGDPRKAIFAGVGKTEEEMQAALKAGVLAFNLESLPEAERLNDVAAAMRKTAPVAIRVNPNVDAKTHKYITTGTKENKFGLSFEHAWELIGLLSEMRNIRLMGIHAHIGSQILAKDPYPRASRVLDEFLEEVIAEGHELETINFGGGFGIAYEAGQKPLELAPVAKAMGALAKKHGLRLMLEPGRSVVGPAGGLLTRVEYIKQGHGKTFAIVDGSMTELIRPSLYQAHHEVLPSPRRRTKAQPVDVVGPVCESSDFMAKDRKMPVPREGDLILVRDAGAYGMVMASNYNARPRPAEVLIVDGIDRLIRTRETYRDLTRHEMIPADF